MKGSDCVPKQFWDFEDASIVSGLNVHSFSLFNLLGCHLWGIMVLFILWSWGLGLYIAMFRPGEPKREKLESTDSSWAIDYIV